MVAKGEVEEPVSIILDYRAKHTCVNTCVKNLEKDETFNDIWGRINCPSAEQMS